MFYNLLCGSLIGMIYVLVLLICTSLKLANARDTHDEMQVAELTGEWCSAYKRLKVKIGLCILYTFILSVMAILQL